MTDNEPSLDTLDRIGGHPALDFVNTVHAWINGKPGREYLHDYADLRRWYRLGEWPELDTGNLPAGKNARERAGALRGAVGLRRALHAIFQAVAEGEIPPRPALDRLNAVVHRTGGFRYLQAAAGGPVAARWRLAGAPAAAVLGPVARAAADLLERGPVDRIKQCPAPEGCGWLFLDHSRNRSRRWCSMETCGNLAKARAHYRRRRKLKKIPR